MTGRAEAGLAALERELARDLARLNHPPAGWVPPRNGPDGGPLVDVLIVGAGMCGLAAAFALRRLGIAGLRQVDRAEAGREGPWLTFARMELLRSPKHLTGPAQGLPALTFRAWYEAQHGVAGWGELGRIPRPMWAEYLAWYGRVTGARIESGIALRGLSPARECVAAEVESLGSGARTVVHARKVVLATGRDALARPRVPSPLAPFAGSLVRHSSEAIDFGALRGKRIAVIGVAASAFDNAACALEAGAAEVVMLARSGKLPRINKAKQIVYAGFTHGFPELPLEERLAILSYILDARTAPPRESVQRCTRHASFSLRLGSELRAAREEAGRLVLDTAAGRVIADLVILGTGFAPDVAAAPELGALAPHIATIRDHAHGAPPADASELMDFPDLDGGFRFRARLHTSDGHAAALGRLHCFGHGAMVSLGNIANDIPAVSEGADRLARAIAADLYLEDREVHWARLLAYSDPELLGDEVPGLSDWEPPVDA